MAALDDVEDTLRLWGITTIVDTVPETGGTFTPTHVMVHHTASAPPDPNPSAELVRDGRVGIPPPLCHLLVRRDLKVEVVSRGRANHAGTGGPWGSIPEDTGNTKCVGIEIEHAGTSAEPWTSTYMAFCRLVVAAVLDHLGEPASHVLAHKEWAPDRKIDPYQWAMGTERGLIADVLAAGPPEVSMSLPAVMVASGQTQQYFVDGNVKRKIVTGAVSDFLVDTLDLPFYSNVPSAVLSLWPTVAVDASGVGQDAASQALAQLATVGAQLASLTTAVADDATSAQVTALAAQVTALAVDVADDATAAQVEEVRVLVEGLTP